MDIQQMSYYNKLMVSAQLLTQIIYKPLYVFKYQNKFEPTVIVFFMLGLIVSMSQYLISTRFDVNTLAENQFIQLQKDSVVDYNRDTMTIAPEDTKRFEAAKKEIANNLKLIPINSFFIYPLSLVFLAVVLYLCQKNMNGSASIQDALYITGFGFWPAFFFNGLLSVIYVFFRTSLYNYELENISSLPLNLASWLTQDTPKPIMALAESVDLFSIWALVLIILGLSTVSKMDIKKSSVLVFSLWCIFLAGKYLMVSMFTPKACLSCGAM
jgi:hypothetical protein